MRLHAPRPESAFRRPFALVRESSNHDWLVSWPNCIALCFLAFLFTCPLAAQQSATRDTTAVSIVMQSLNAMGVGGSSFPVTDSVVTGQVTVPHDTTGLPRSVTIQTKGADHIRFDTTADGVTTTSVAAGAVGRVKKGDYRRALPITVSLARSRIEHIPVLLLAGEFFRSDTSLAYAGQEMIMGRTAHHVVFQTGFTVGDEAIRQAFAKASTVEVFIDAQTFTVSEIRYEAPSERDWRVSFPMKVQYGNYKEIQGLLVPTQITQFAQDRQSFTLQLTTVAFNQGVADAVFDVR